MHACRYELKECMELSCLNTTTIPPANDCPRLTRFNVNEYYGIVLGRFELVSILVSQLSTNFQRNGLYNWYLCTSPKTPPRMPLNRSLKRIHPVLLPTHQDCFSSIKPILRTILHLKTLLLPFTTRRRRPSRSINSIHLLENTLLSTRSRPVFGHQFQPRHSPKPLAPLPLNSIRGSSSRINFLESSSTIAPELSVEIKESGRQIREKMMAGKIFRDHGTFNFGDVWGW